MPKKDPRVDAYIEKSADFAKPILKRIRRLFHKASSTIEENIKWSVPTFEYKGIVGTMAAFKQHVSVGFWKAGLMQDPASIFVNRDGSSICSAQFASNKDLPSDDVLLVYIHQAIDLNEREIKQPKKRFSRSQEVAVPPEFQTALKRSRTARETFEAFSPSHRREYVEWITEAKRDETRKRRITQAIEMLQEGKSRNWKYE